MYGSIIFSSSDRVTSKSSPSGAPPAPAASSWIVPATTSSSDSLH
jgi:hypothetical protein